MFKGIGADGAVAIKRLHINAGNAAHREMAIGAFIADRVLQHVVPILDYGQDANSDRYYLVMPICEHSLQEVINKTGNLLWPEAQKAALDILRGLKEVGDITHRDLKPGNVLWYQGRWCVADFGIAKFVEDSTSLETLRSALTPSYGAPEQWSGSRPTGATDIYALGCVMHTLLTGHPPFTGDLDTVRDAHLHSAPPVIQGLSPKLNGFLGLMLRKSPESRPDIDRCIGVLSEPANESGSKALSALEAAGLHVARQQADEEAKRQRIQTITAARDLLSKEAIGSLKLLRGRLFDHIKQAAPPAEIDNESIALGAGLLYVTNFHAHSYAGDPETTWDKTSWDVAAFAFGGLRCTIEKVSYSDPNLYTFSATFVFARVPNDPTYRWREVSFYQQWGNNFNSSPVSLSPASPDFYSALSTSIMGNFDVAHGPHCIDGEFEDEFVERWTGLFAKAAQGKLRPPDRLPLPDGFFS